MKTKILIVDDDLSILKVLVRVLSREPFLITTASSGHEAIEVLKSDTFDVLTTDLEMADGDGIELARWALANHPGIKIIFLTGHPSDERIQALSDRLYAIVAKPWPPEKIIDLLRAAGKEESV